MQHIERPAVALHWEYYIELEKDLLTASRYVNFTEDQLSVHSQFFTQILVCAATEFECVCKVIADKVEISNVGNIGSIKEMLSPIMPTLSQCQLELLRGSLRTRPFADWEEIGTPLCWWTSYNDTKHLRNRDVSPGSLRNAMYALGGLFIANLVLANTLKEYEALIPHQLFAIQPFVDDADPLFKPRNYYQRPRFSLLEKDGKLKPTPQQTL
tara:strand:- start:377 stop:1012 length:636 start_codon:yes stop_codon:yes gene_type:complete